MTNSIAPHGDRPQFFETPMDGEEVYLRLLNELQPPAVEFHIGAGRIYYGVERHLPDFQGQEAEKSVLCNAIADAVYPLAACLYAQAVSIRLMMIDSNTSVDWAQHKGLASCTIFDIHQHRRISFIFHPDDPSVAALLAPYQGLAVVCEPMVINYHRMKDDRKRTAHIKMTLWEWTARAVNEWYDQKPPLPTQNPDLVARAPSQDPKKGLDQIVATVVDAIAAALPAALPAALAARALKGQRVEPTATTKQQATPAQKDVAPLPLRGTAQAPEPDKIAPPRPPMTPTGVISPTQATARPDSGSVAEIVPPAPHPLPQASPVAAGPVDRIPERPQSAFEARWMAQDITPSQHIAPMAVPDMGLGNTLMTPASTQPHIAMPQPVVAPQIQREETQAYRPEAIPAEAASVQPSATPAIAEHISTADRQNVEAPTDREQPQQSAQPQPAARQPEPRQSQGDQSTQAGPPDEPQNQEKKPEPEATKSEAKAQPSSTRETAEPKAQVQPERQAEPSQQPQQPQPQQPAAQQAEARAEPQAAQQRDATSQPTTQPAAQPAVQPSTQSTPQPTTAPTVAPQTARSDATSEVVAKASPEASPTATSPDLHAQPRQTVVGPQPPTIPVTAARTEEEYSLLNVQAQHPDYQSRLSPEAIMPHQAAPVPKPTPKTLSPKTWFRPRPKPEFPSPSPTPTGFGGVFGWWKK